MLDWLTLDRLAIAVPVGWVLLVNFFAALYHAKAIIARGEKIHWTFKVPLAIGGVIGWLLDVVLLNWFVGTLFVFYELPRELTFTSRLKRHSRGLGRWRKRAEWWCEQINKFDQGHC